MDRNDKVAAAKRKLRKFQQRSKTCSPAKVADRSETPSGNDQSRLSADLKRGATSPRASSTDLFRQISSEASGILADVGRTTEKGSSLPDSDTAHRSSELNDSKHFAGALKVQTTLVKDLNQQLQKQAEALNAQYQENARLRRDFRRLQSDDGGVEKLRTELLAVTEQLKGHEQTIDILVEEKSELHTKLTRQNVIIQEKTSECQELMRRLQAGSERIRQLEMALEEAHTDLQQHKQNRASDEKNSSSLQASVRALSNENEELKHQVSELTNKLVAQSKTSASLDGQLKEARSKLSLAETLVQQLSGGSDDAKEREESYKAMKTQNEQLVAQLNETIRSLQSLSAEHEETKRKFQEVFNQYEGRAQALANQVSTLTNEKGLLVGRLQQQTAAVKELELKLDETVRHQTAQLDHTHTIQQLTTENENLSAHLAAMTDENRTLQTLKEEMSAKLEEYEVTVTRLGEEAVDRAKLLSDMQNDKATISRALLQNKELKSQLEELQQAFVKLTNDNMQLASDLQTSQHWANQLSSQLNDKREELETRDLQAEAEQFEEEKRKVDELQTNDADLVGKQAEMSIRDVAENEKTIREDEIEVHRDEADDDGESEQKKIIESLSASVRQLEMERNSLFQHLQELKKENEVIRQTSDDVRASSVSFGQLETSFNQLQDQFVRVMREKAELSDDVQRMEHVIMQLEGETETIGEYIALYHHQRDQLRVKFDQKDKRIEHLMSQLSQSQERFSEIEKLLNGLLPGRESQSESTVESLVDHSGNLSSSTVNDRQVEEVLRLVHEASQSSAVAWQPPESNYYREYVDNQLVTSSFFPFSGDSGREVLVL